MAKKGFQDEEMKDIPKLVYPREENFTVVVSSVFELALRGHDETQTSDNPGIFRGLINFTAELDKTLAQHLEESTVFKGISKEIQNNILDCMLELCQDKILEEIRESPYLAVMADEITDISAKSQMVVVFRYCRNGAPVERFWTYLVPSKLNADTLSKNIFSVLDPILENSNNKLIAQSYDGAAVMCGQHAGVQARIKEKYPFAHFVHCYAHRLNLIMSKACSENSQLTFFHRIMPQVDVLYNALQKTKTDPLEINKKVTDFERYMNSVRNSIDDTIDQGSSLCVEPLPTKRLWKDNSPVDHRRASIEVCDIIINCANDRFAFKNHLLATSLLYPEQFDNYCDNFPDDNLSLTCASYPNLDRERLKTELSVIYFRRDCRDINGAIPFLKFLIENDLTEPFQETVKLLQILITVPMSTAEAERCFSSLKRIKTFLRNSMTEDRLVALTMLSVEKTLIKEIPNFNEKVIDKFALKKIDESSLFIKKK
ncbi:uncharacterized protein [Diabrotica undecimpunctata]|uniref:uncharacterized protein n=1 Tax=Diabrotica undecimpunctata TaxID=50387 RepID=UPI003B640FB3